MLGSTAPYIFAGSFSQRRCNVRSSRRANRSLWNGALQKLPGTELPSGLSPWKLIGP
jgi:hypothetical protein